jgi:hypothetical protein
MKNLAVLTPLDDVASNKVEDLYSTEIYDGHHLFWATQQRTLGPSRDEQYLCSAPVDGGDNPRRVVGPPSGAPYGSSDCLWHRSGRSVTSRKKRLLSCVEQDDSRSRSDVPR